MYSLPVSFAHHECDTNVSDVLLHLRYTVYEIEGPQNVDQALLFVVQMRHSDF
jgi:hypothetical protein